MKSFVGIKLPLKPTDCRMCGDPLPKLSKETSTQCLRCKRWFILGETGRVLRVHRPTGGKKKWLDP